MKKKLYLFVILILCLIFPSKAQEKGYEKSLEIGYSQGIGTINNDVINISMINGYRLSNALYAGIGIGIGYSNLINHYEISSFGITREFRTEGYLIPIFANIKTYLTQNNKISPFLSLNIGYTIDVRQYLKDAPGFFIQPNFGVDFKTSKESSIYLVIGFNLQHYNYTYTRKGSNPFDYETSNKSEMLKAIDFKIGFMF